MSKLASCFRPGASPPSLRTAFNRIGKVRGFAKRDAPLPPLTNPVEQAIAAAQQRGQLNNLSGAGKPLSSKSNSISSRPVAGMSTSELLSKKAEFEMRRAVKNRELEHLEGQTLQYRGTTIVSPSLSSNSGGSPSGSSEKSGATIMGQYILKQAQPSVKDLK
ncbi:expressed unknown protein [Seminavis robusta]|uniref:DnaJ homologue subfamily C member 28 conserved domain-containing protein n=1 Tax=Seminavis robusta TaxID=568900 RepID=A0A9N8HFP1_9STRA|nr:expressed unknown protein [Seminavis robusta]|eukprot:Sro534_g161810.1 n/a (162) ;mRNA; r:44468-44953